MSCFTEVEPVPEDRYKPGRGTLGPCRIKSHVLCLSLKMPPRRERTTVIEVITAAHDLLPSHGVVLGVMGICRRVPRYLTAMSQKLRVQC